MVIYGFRDTHDETPWGKDAVRSGKPQLFDEHFSDYLRFRIAKLELTHNQRPAGIWLRIEVENLIPDETILKIKVSWIVAVSGVQTTRSQIQFGP